MLLDHLSRLCRSSKKPISAEETVTVVVQSVSCRTALVARLLGFCQDKNAQLRLFGCWVKEVIVMHTRHLPKLRDGNILSALHKTILRGIVDPKPHVRCM